MPHVVTAHSLEPLRPWKAEQLGGGYALSSWGERTAIEAADAVIAVSGGMRDDVLRATRPSTPAGCTSSTTASTPRSTSPTPRRPTCWSGIGIDPDRPSVVFVGRITRQKGLPLPAARGARRSTRRCSWCCCAGAPDTDEIAAEVEVLVEELRRDRDGVVWVQEMLPKPEVIQVLTHATVFVCPSVYEPMGIVNLEAMACETPWWRPRPAASRRWSPTARPGCWCRSSSRTTAAARPLDPSRFEADLAAALSQVLADPARAREMGVAGRRRAVEHFSWATIATRTLDLYRGLL